MLQNPGGKGGARIMNGGGLSSCGVGAMEGTLPMLGGGLGR